MPLSTAIETLKLDILVALMNVKESANVTHGEKKSDEDAILEAYANELATAIHNYTLQAVVTTTVNSIVIGTAAPLAPTGAAPVIGKGTGAGNGNLS